MSFVLAQPADHHHHIVRDMNFSSGFVRTGLMAIDGDDQYSGASWSINHDKRR